MKKNIIRFSVLVGTSIGLFANSAIASANSMYKLPQIDPSPYSGNIASYSGISSRQCSTRCQNNPNCQSYYWVNGNCWLKSVISEPERKTFESGEGGIKVY